MKKTKPTEMHEACRQEILAVLEKHIKLLPAQEVLAIISNMVGMTIALQDKGTMSTERAMTLVLKNIEQGNISIVNKMEASACSRCQRTDCDREATHTPRINLPAKGHAIATHQPAKMYVGLKLCKDHANEIQAEDIGSLTKDLANTSFDFARGWVTAIRLDSDEYREYELRAGNTLNTKH